MTHTQFFASVGAAFIGTLLAMLLWVAVMVWRSHARPMEDETVIMDHSEPNPVGFCFPEGVRE